jgi:hypothetical protein
MRAREQRALARHRPLQGLTKVGLPGTKKGLQKEDVTLAELLKWQE